MPWAGDGLKFAAVSPGAESVGFIFRRKRAKILP